MNTPQMSMRRVFKIGLKENQLTDLLYRCYRYEVALRGRSYVEMEDIMTVFQTISALLTGDSPHFGFILAGGVGRGKTTVLKALQRAINSLTYHGYLENDTALRMVGAKTVQKESNMQRFKSLCYEPLLAIDDLGNEATEQVSYGQVTTPIIDLLEYRYDKQLFTCFSTNLTPAERRNRYGERIADRCREMCVNIVFKNGSYR